MFSEEKCSSCGTPLKGEKSVSFLCPSCGNIRIGRCGLCRDQSARYTCPECGFMGP
ncbi:MAG TPA: DUF1610 domain-containing protein [Euryarchaeota archaeon]|nr:MAG: hypothetical protein B6U90_03070 [Thermoplasmatales archaeon ex4484_6]RLF68400.1 MAG: hypothetical protein DRN57_04175 [Thermoplasmata archaeon]HHD16649.1 DUF1610 domain-containing protein [Euryarchaeota archaeon]